MKLNCVFRMLPSVMLGWSLGWFPACCFINALAVLNVGFQGGHADCNQPKDLFPILKLGLNFNIKITFVRRLESTSLSLVCKPGWMKYIIWYKRDTCWRCRLLSTSPLWWVIICRPTYIWPCNTHIPFTAITGTGTRFTVRLLLFHRAKWAIWGFHFKAKAPARLWD